MPRDCCCWMYAIPSSGLASSVTGGASESLSALVPNAALPLFPTQSCQSNIRPEMEIQVQTWTGRVVGFDTMSLTPQRNLVGWRERDAGLAIIIIAIIRLVIA